MIIPSIRSNSLELILLDILSICAIESKGYILGDVDIGIHCGTVWVGSFANCETGTIGRWGIVESLTRFLTKYCMDFHRLGDDWSPDHERSPTTRQLAKQHLSIPK